MPRRVKFSADLILVCNSLDAGGIERVVATLANEWGRRGRKVCVVTLHDRHRFYALDPAVQHVVLDEAGLIRFAELLKWLAERVGPSRWPKGWPFKLISAPLNWFFSDRHVGLYFLLLLSYQAASLRRALRRVTSPVVVSLGTKVNILTVMACGKLGRRVIISERGDAERLAGLKGWNSLSRRFYGRADLVTANSRGALRGMSDFVEAGKLAFVPNPLVLPNGGDRVRGDGRETPPYVLVVGRLVWGKAHDVLLEAFARLGAEFEGWRLAVVGDGRLRGALQAQAESLGIAGRVDWHGVVRDPYDFYRAARIFVLPSRNEGMPNALLEAMSCGLPVVVSDGAPGPLELVEDGVTGLVVPVNNAEALASAIRRLAADGALRERLGEAARERVAAYELPQSIAVWESVLGLDKVAGSQ
ncbi:MAG TPA: glycosyltransferase [Pyrinomonadaceae bacterium]|nr:glycosyltransferase [Pyrinomonadaceae bacterium]